MELTLGKKAHVFRLPVSLLEKLKEMARKENRSLNNLVETILLNAIAHETNDLINQS